MEDKPITLTCRVTGLPRPEVTWLKDNKEITQSPNIKVLYDGDKCTLTIKRASMDHEGEYKVVANNSAGTADIMAPITVEGKNNSSITLLKILFLMIGVVFAIILFKST